MLITQKVGCMTVGWLGLLALAILPAQSRADEGAKDIPSEVKVSSVKSEKSASVPRDPFWPIGYRSTAPGGAPNLNIATNKQDMIADSEQEWKEATEKLQYKGSVFAGGKYRAIVNNEICEVGNVIRVMHKNKIFRFRLSYIDAKRVRFEPIKEERRHDTLQGNDGEK